MNLYFTNLVVVRHKLPPKNYSVGTYNLQCMGGSQKPQEWIIQHTGWITSYLSIFIGYIIHVKHTDFTASKIFLIWVVLVTVLTFILSFSSNLDTTLPLHCISIFLLITFLCKAGTGTFNYCYDYLGYCSNPRFYVVLET